jgi:hypothetical protein
MSMNPLDLRRDTSMLLIEKRKGTTMTARTSSLILVAFVLFAVLIASPSFAAVVTFDELSETGSGAFLPTSYQSLTWSNFFINNAILRTNILYGGPQGPHTRLTGNYYGMVSQSNVVMCGIGDGGEIDSFGTNFNFLSAYLTGDYYSNLNIEVQGFRAGTLLYDQTVIASATNPTLFVFGYTNIDRLYFAASGGQPAFEVSPSPRLFAMDNLTFEFVPEPSGFLLTTAGALLLWPLLKGKQA